MSTLASRTASAGNSFASPFANRSAIWGWAGGRLLSQTWLGVTSRSAGQLSVLLLAAAHGCDAAQVARSIGEAPRPATVLSAAAEPGANQQLSTAASRTEAIATLPPARLSCLANNYVGTPIARNERWYLQLPQGKLLPFEDGRTKTAEALLEDPDLNDIFAYPYPHHPAAKLRTPVADPGRIRVDALLQATYGASARDVGRSLVVITINEQRLRVHSKVADRFKRLATSIAALLRRSPELSPYFEKLGGTFIWRQIAGTQRLSAHSFGISLDLNPALATYWRWGTPKQLPHAKTLPSAIVDLFEAERFIWGGRWLHVDSMHFEYRPELFDGACDDHASVGHGRGR